MDFRRAILTVIILTCLCRLLAAQTVNHANTNDKLTRDRTTADESSKAETNQIALFCRLWGFLKYHHPAVATGRLDWDSVFMTRLPFVMSERASQDIDAYYFEWIKSLGEVTLCKKCITNPKGTFRENWNINWLNNTNHFSSALTSALQNIYRNRYTGSNFYAFPTPNIGNPSFSNEKVYADAVFPSVEMRLLGLARFWNVVNYFFPYKYRIGEDWDKALEEMIPKFRDPADTVAYHLAMCEVVAKIHDSHAGLVTPYTNEYFGFKWAPFQFKIIDHKAVVTGFYNDSLCHAGDVRIGDVFLTIDGESIEQVVQRKSKYISASNEAVKLRNFWFALFNGKSDSVLTTLAREGVTIAKWVKRYDFDNFKSLSPSDTVSTASRLIAGNLGYVHMGRLKSGNVKATLDKLRDTKAIIFDLRHYPDGTLAAISDFLNTSKKPFARLILPDYTSPGLYRYTPLQYCGRRNNDAYQGKVIVLINEYTQSQAEYTAMALQTAPNATIIGSQTAGADGNVSTITFPGGYQTYFTGLGVFYPDGRETQRIGIVPDIEVHPTIEGIQRGKDELLDFAVEMARRL